MFLFMQKHYVHFKNHHINVTTTFFLILLQYQKGKKFWNFFFFAFFSSPIWSKFYDIMQISHSFLCLFKKYLISKNMKTFFSLSIILSRCKMWWNEIESKPQELRQRIKFSIIFRPEKNIFFDVKSIVLLFTSWTCPWARKWVSEREKKIWNTEHCEGVLTWKLKRKWKMERKRN